MSEATTVDNQPVPSRAKNKIFVTWGRRTGQCIEDSTVYGHCIEMYYFYLMSFLCNGLVTRFYYGYLGDRICRSIKIYVVNITP